ncbi:hypothetical protein FA13DRAFT_1792451 [Coprinellus micaceus]|uniref:Uncharacterized protein n=1 Tax=Coprinellus micaceus TaxID=71717 RepID=A0A4Y7T933_COPMI|nr:hypothetical protein FA13DRAFT_1792451 [Coprinellus micaceus]
MGGPTGAHTPTWGLPAPPAGATQPIIADGPPTPPIHSTKPPPPTDASEGFRTHWRPLVQPHDPINADGRGLHLSQQPPPRHLLPILPSAHAAGMLEQERPGNPGDGHEHDVDVGDDDLKGRPAKP